MSNLNDTDADLINDNEDAAPFDATVGQVSITIHTPLSGSTIQWYYAHFYIPNVLNLLPPCFPESLISYSFHFLF